MLLFPLMGGTSSSDWKFADGIKLFPEKRLPASGLSRMPFSIQMQNRYENRTRKEREADQDSLN